MTLFHSRSPRIHFVGIGGIGMSGIAELLLNLGYPVSGSDLRSSETTRRLAGLGGRVELGHSADHVGDADVVVISSAVRRDNPEVVEARRRKIPVIPRAEMLAELMRLKQGIAIAGSHGKTTTTSMAAHLMAHAGLDPTVVVGGKMNAFGSNAKLGKGDWIVVEADESDGSFLHYAPTLVVVTNVDPEHLDHWKTEEALKRGFVDFVNKVPFYGTAVLCIDHPGVQSILPFVDKRFVTYGEAPQADYRATRVEVLGPRVAFEATRRGEPLGRFEVNMVGRHNALNALSVVALADELGVPVEVTRSALASFQGVQRRFTIRGERGRGHRGGRLRPPPRRGPGHAPRRPRGLRAPGGLRLPAPPLHPHPRPSPRVPDRLQRRRRAPRHRRLRRLRGAHSRHLRSRPGRGHPRLRPQGRPPRGPRRAGGGGTRPGDPGRRGDHAGSG